MAARSGAPTAGAPRLIVNPSLVLMQRRLFAPNYDGPGKWVIFDPSSRRSFLAVERQSDFENKMQPTILRMLLAHSRGEHDDSDATAQLTRNRLLVEHGPSQPEPTFLSRFQQSVFDYPFFDYSTPETFQKDRQLMATYEDDSPAPPPWTPREGHTVELPAVGWADLAALRDRPFELRHLAAVLRFTFGPVGELPNLGKRMHYRRTSPSGGAKHPTEGWLNVTAAWKGLAPGLYVYDCVRHALVRVQSAGRGCRASTTQPISFSLRSRIERPMWRYRDGRSFRAIAIDAGHVIETLALLLGMFGIGVAVRPAGRPGAGFRWLREPEIAQVVPSLVSAECAPSPPTPVLATPLAATAAEMAAGSLGTSPAMYFTVDDGAFRAHLVHPRLDSFVADEVDFAILTHCILSHRGPAHQPNDRLTTPRAVLDEVPGATAERLRRLVARRALLPDLPARLFYAEVRRWAERGWYQPLLTWLEAVNALQDSPLEAPVVRRTATSCNLPQALRGRVTTRRFSKEPVARESLLTLIRESYAAADSTAAVTCYVGALNIDGLPPNDLQIWDNRTQTLVASGETVTPSEVSELTIGQQWLTTCAAAIWLVTRIDVSRPDRYFLTNILLGRMAQTICVVGTDHGLGVFQTPAIEDRKFAAKIGLPEDPALTAYLVCIGSRLRPAS